MNRFISIVLVLALFTSVSAFSQELEPIPEVDHSTVGYKSVAEALAALRARKDLDVSVYKGWTIFGEKSETDMTIWSVSPEGYPAYPAVVKRHIFEKDGAWYVTMGVLCQAAKAPCDQLVRDYEELDRRLKEQLRQATHAQQGTPGGAGKASRP